MARIFKRGKILWLGYYANGKEHCQSLKLADSRHNRKLADEIKLKKELELKQRLFAVATNNLMLSDAVYSFFLYKNILHSKQSVYHAAIKNFTLYLNDDIFVKAIKQHHLKNFAVYLKQASKSESTIATYLNHLSIFSRWLLQEQYIDTDFSYKIRPRKNEPMIIPDKALKKIFLYLRIHCKRQYYLIKFLYLTGFRKSEALSLTWNQIDFETRTIYVNNTKANRTDIFPLYPELIKLLNEIPHQQKRLFNYSKDGLKFWNKSLVRLKLNHYSLHDLRRKFGTMMAEKGLTPYELQRVMRHQNIRTSMQYYVNIDMRNIAGKM